MFLSHGRSRETFNDNLSRYVQNPSRTARRRKLVRTEGPRKSEASRVDSACGLHFSECIAVDERWRYRSHRFASTRSELTNLVG